MYLTQLVYASKITSDFKPVDIESILLSARKHNEKNNITGVLCFNSKSFLQCLEGSRAKVNQTYHRILNDPRHTDIIMLDYQELIEREFDNWTMGYVPESSLTAPVNLKYSGSPEFDPYDMSGASAHNLLLSLKDSVPTLE